ncbi:unnamed protein product [Orchesella dallaii]|uniref:C2H2-type domain-containing protein n=1 Tax=Orchesella dallaii TaxID=48710 RepID=A0ABP1R2Q3_9HEXA
MPICLQIVFHQTLGVVLYIVVVVVLPVSSHAQEILYDFSDDLQMTKKEKELVTTGVADWSLSNSLIQKLPGQSIELLPRLKIPLTSETFGPRFKSVEVIKKKTHPETTTTKENISSHGKGKKSTEILLEGDINAAWNEEEGTLSLDVPDLASLKQILGLDLESEESLSNRKVSIQSKNQSNSNIDEDWEENFINSPAPSETPSNSQDFSKSSPTKTKTKSSSSSLALRKVKKKRKRPTHDKARFGGHSCDQCPFRAMRAPSLEAHRKLHNPDSNVKAVACPICKWVLPPTRLYIHNKHHHPSELPENEDGKKQRAGASHSYYKCPECGALFIFLVYLRSHMKLHEKGEGITCTDCGWLTTNLTRHMSHWHPPEGSWRAEQRSRLSSAYRIRECTFLKIENGSKPDGESGNNDD